MDDQKYTNSFADVHAKVKVLKERAREESKNDAEVRESRLVNEFKGIADIDRD